MHHVFFLCFGWSSWSIYGLKQAIAPDPLHISSSVAVLAEISLSSPRKLFIFIIKKYISRIKVSKNMIIWFWKTSSLVSSNCNFLQIIQRSQSKHWFCFQKQIKHADTVQMLVGVCCFYHYGRHAGGHLCARVNVGGCVLLLSLWWACRMSSLCVFKCWSVCAVFITMVGMQEVIFAHA